MDLLREYFTRKTLCPAGPCQLALKPAAVATTCTPVGFIPRVFACAARDIERDETASVTAMTTLIRSRPNRVIVPVGVCMRTLPSSYLVPRPSEHRKRHLPT